MTSDAQTYTVRRHGFEKERQWRITDQGLSATSPELLAPWNAIHEIRLTYAPTQYDRNRYECEVGHAKGRARINSMNFDGFASLSDRAASYRPFVRALISEAARRNPRIRFATGVSPLAYWLNAFIAVVLLTLMVGVIIMIGFPNADTYWLHVIDVLLIIVSLPILWGWFIKNQSGRFDPDNVPEEILPPAP
jgi:hypothetical protein